MITSGALTPGRGRRRVNRHRTRTVKTLPDGSFLLRPMERGVSYHVAAYAPEHRKSTVSAAAVAVGCVPGGPLTTLQVDTGVERGKQGLVGLLRDHNGTPVAQASVLVRRLPLDSEERWQLRGEAFRIPLQPGRYEIAFQVPAYGTFSPPAITVQKERYSLLRSMRLPKPGAFAIEIIENASGDVFAYDVNVNTNYNADAGRRAGASGMGAVARYLGVELARQTEGALEAFCVLS
ncbi:MAG: carboxypeptidase regulatory-like domain-containing protein [Planctomycetes bacterium]|nr:carboxypeptidase regulatory-like domain-containing protein [Planctomycetota bacterium]